MTTTPFDLGAAVIRVRATRETTVQNHLGRTVYRQFIPVLQPGTSPADGDSRLPFSASGLMQPGGTTPVSGTVAAGSEAWLRVAALDTATCSHLDAFRASPTALDLDHVLWEVVGVSLDDAPWAATTHYQALMMSAHTLPEPPSRIGFVFASATTFRADGENIAAPLPHLVFNALGQRWAEVTRMPVRPAALWEAFTQYHIVLESKVGQTEEYRIKDGGKEIGFVGEAHYAFNAVSAHLARTNPKLEAEIRDDFPNLCRVAAMLAEYARFAGIGRRTGAGMGMARPI
ncbi:MAG: CRISPR system precrRNA processing endoribonuclease RAMP protein Cas6 [Anaerolineae bacterium]|jgi:CRISPR/Cas system endoribonuclease Cas6 (RAMP superfamily)|nr:CRISPR system precrRNA processing endoribonuclease RAMP protein Cas6 [Anaerolineae bacterium]